MQKSIEEIERILDQPLDPYSVEWKPFDGTKGNSDWVQYAPYIDARAVRRILDAAFTRWGWSADYREIDGGFMCTITATISSVNRSDNPLVITKTDGANRSQVEPVKGGISDALKRAAVGFGIGSSLYEFPKISIKKFDRQGKPAAQLYHVMEWALPELDRLVLAWGGGWRPRGDKVFLSPDRKPEWDSYTIPAPPVRSADPEVVATKTELDNPPVDEEKSAHQSKKQVAESDKLYREMSEEATLMLTTEQFSALWKQISASTVLFPEQKNILYLHLRKKGHRWAVGWTKNPPDFCNVMPELDALGQTLVNQWLMDLKLVKNQPDIESYFRQLQKAPYVIYLHLVQRVFAHCELIKVRFHFDSLTDTVVFTPN